MGEEEDIEKANRLFNDEYDRSRREAEKITGEQSKASKREHREKWEAQQEVNKVNDSVNDETASGEKPKQPPREEPKRHGRPGDQEAKKDSKHSGKNDDWPDPQPLEDYLRPVLPPPLDKMPATFSNWIKDITHQKRCAPDFPAATALESLNRRSRCI